MTTPATEQDQLPKSVRQAREAITVCKWMIRLLFSPMLIVAVAMYPEGGYFAPDAGLQRTLMMFGLAGNMICAGVIIALKGVANTRG